MPLSGRVSHLVVDCADVDRVAEFWSSMLGLEVTSRRDPYVILEPLAEGGPALTFQRVPEPKAGKNRVHFDVSVDDIEEATHAAVAAGATVLSEVKEHGGTMRILGDVEGNEFCLVDFPA